MVQRQVALFPAPDSPSDDGALIDAAQTTVQALREQGAIEPWHELDVTIVQELARAVTESRGIAKSQMFGALLQARARLPEPVVATIEPEALEYEGARAIEYYRRHSAELADEEDAEPVD